MNATRLRGVEEMGYPVDDFELPQCPIFGAELVAIRDRIDAHPRCRLRGIEDYLAWVPEEMDHLFPMRCFYDGDYSDVLEIDDPLIQDALLRAQA